MNIIIFFQLLMTRMKSKTKIASGWESWAQQQVLYMYDAILNFPS